MIYSDLLVISAIEINVFTCVIKSIHYFPFLNSLLFIPQFTTLHFQIHYFPLLNSLLCISQFTTLHFPIHYFPFPNSLLCISQFTTLHFPIHYFPFPQFTTFHFFNPVLNFQIQRIRFSDSLLFISERHNMTQFNSLLNIP